MKSLLPLYETHKRRFGLQTNYKNDKNNNLLCKLSIITMYLCHHNSVIRITILLNDKEAKWDKYTQSKTKFYTEHLSTRSKYIQSLTFQYMCKQDSGVFMEF